VWAKAQAQRLEQLAAWGLQQHWGWEQVRDRIVALPAGEQEQFLEWQSHEGSLAYFTKASFTRGCWFAATVQQNMGGRKHLSLAV
jgi:hypothetical protein